MGKVGNTADEAAARRLVREAAERARRVEILDKIHKLEREKAECVECISSLSSAAGQLSGLSSSWNLSYGNGMKSDILREVTLSGIFEGTTAESVKSGMGTAMGKMKSSMSSIEQVAGEVSVQIGKLNQYIDKLDTRINGLRASL